MSELRKKIEELLGLDYETKLKDLVGFMCLQTTRDEHTIKELESQLAASEQREDLLVEALEFYKDKQIRYNKIFCTSDTRLTNINYETMQDEGVTMVDDGKIAREALTKHKEMSKSKN